MENKINNLLNLINANRKDRSSGFVIGNTSDLFDINEIYFTPVRETENLIYAGVVVKNISIASKVAELIDGKVNYIFVDAEKKIRQGYQGPEDMGDVEKAVRAKVTNCRILTYKGNDLGAEAVYFLLEQLTTGLGHKKVSIIGAGNLGSKIALKMVECGADTVIYRRDIKKLDSIANGLNDIKTRNTRVKISIAENIADAVSGADVIVACANEKGIINKECFYLMNNNGPHIIIDAGKGCFSDEFIDLAEAQGINIYRTDVSIIQKNLFSAIIETCNAYSIPIGRKKIIEDVAIVSLGLLGKYGEIIVDNIEKPKKIIGISDGKGSLLVDTSAFASHLDHVNRWILSNE